MQAGIARAKITPDGPVWMAGYAYRDRPAEAVYHDLHAKALALKDGDETVLIISFDLIGFDREKCAEVTAAIEAATGLDPEKMVLAASHTHTGPEVQINHPTFVEERNDAYAAALTTTLARIAREALDDCEEVDLALGSAPCAIAVNRRLQGPDGVMQMKPNPHGATDPVASALRIRRRDGSAKGVLMHYACHATTVGGYLIGTDYPGFAQDHVEREIEGCTAFFVQGCAGDQKVRHLDGKGSFKSGPWQAAQSLGEELGRAVMAALTNTRPIDGALRCGFSELPLPFAHEPSEEEVEAALDSEELKNRRWAKAMLRLREETGSFIPDEPFTVQVISIGDFSLITLSAEMCVGYSLRIKAKRGNAPTLVAGYCNGMIGYVANAEQFAEGGYEVAGYYIYHPSPSPYTPTCESLIMARVDAMLAELRGAPPHYDALCYVPESEDPSITVETDELILKIIDNTGLLAPPVESSSYFNQSHVFLPFTHHLGYHGIRCFYYKSECRNLVVPFASWLNLQTCTLQGIQHDPVDERAWAGVGRGWPMRLERKGAGALLTLEPQPTMQLGYSLEIQPGGPDAIDFSIRFKCHRKPENGPAKLHATWPCYMNVFDDLRLYYPRGVDAQDVTWTALGERPPFVIGDPVQYEHEQTVAQAEDQALPLGYGRIGDRALILMFSDPEVRLFHVNTGGHYFFSPIQNPAWDFAWTCEDYPLETAIGFDGRIIYAPFDGPEAILTRYREWAV
jgi:neutral/alkaline ceramidase-like enzyme